MNILEFLHKFFTPESPPPHDSSFARIILAVHNTERTSRDLPKLQLNEKLSAAAIQHARWMNDTKLVSHVGPHNCSVLDRVQYFNYHAKAIGENLAIGFNSISGVMVGWMSSSGHRKNILGNYQEMGCGRVNDCWCIIFATPKISKDDDTVIISYGGSLDSKKL